MISRDELKSAIRESSITEVSRSSDVHASRLSHCSTAMCTQHEAALDDMFRAADRDGDGLIAYDEFVKVLEISAPGRQ